MSHGLGRAARRDAFRAGAGSNACGMRNSQSSVSSLRQSNEDSLPAPHLERRPRKSAARNPRAASAADRDAAAGETPRPRSHRAGCPASRRVAVAGAVAAMDRRIFAASADWAGRSMTLWARAECERERQPRRQSAPRVGGPVAATTSPPPAIICLFDQCDARVAPPRYKQIRIIPDYGGMWEGVIIMTFNTTTQWGWPAKALHWIGAAIILVLLVHDWWMTHMTPRPDRLANYAWHSALGYDLHGADCAAAVVAMVQIRCRRCPPISSRGSAWRRVPGTSRSTCSC